VVCEKTRVQEPAKCLNCTRTFFVHPRNGDMWSVSISTFPTDAINLTNGPMPSWYNDWAPDLPTPIARPFYIHTSYPAVVLGVCQFMPEMRATVASLNIEGGDTTSHRLKFWTSHGK